MKIRRRNFLRIGVYSSIALAISDLWHFEPKWITRKNIKLNKEKIRKRIVHITDIHYKGDDNYLRSVVNKVNNLKPDFICFTGDIVEDKKYLQPSLEILSQLKYPIYGVPGNHEYWSGASFNEIKICFENTGGAWIVDSAHLTHDKEWTILGSAEQNTKVLEIKSEQGDKKILLTHYPKFVEKIKDNVYDLILAGHSHGGQVRLPLWGALIVPYGVGIYDCGLYKTQAGPLYVNPGIGTYFLDIRFNCRPEITVIEV